MERIAMSIKLYFRAVCRKQGFAECLYGFREKSLNKYIKFLTTAKISK